MDEINIGKKIFDFRKAKKLTINDFSKITGLSSALLSQLERGVGNPSLSALKSIANALDISVSSLLKEEISNEALIIRKADKREINNINGKFIMFDILGQSHVRSDLELFTMELSPNSESSDRLTDHVGQEEIAYVIEGELVAILNDEEFVLYEGDTVRILPGRKHRFKNKSSARVNVLLIKRKLT
jgi:transcriptional regulator with XRE-family HTH domain